MTQENEILDEKDANHADKNGNLEDTLQTLLSKYITRWNRTLTIGHHNERDAVIVACPCAAICLKSFIIEADPSK
jgi:hypothetical protein